MQNIAKVVVIFWNPNAMVNDKKNANGECEIAQTGTSH